MMTNTCESRIVITKTLTQRLFKHNGDRVLARALSLVSWDMLATLQHTWSLTEISQMLLR